MFHTVYTSRLDNPPKRRYPSFCGCGIWHRVGNRTPSLVLFNCKPIHAVMVIDPLWHHVWIFLQCHMTYYCSNYLKIKSIHTPSVRLQMSWCLTTRSVGRRTRSCTTGSRSSRQTPQSRPKFFQPRPPTSDIFGIYLAATVPVFRTVCV